MLVLLAVGLVGGGVFFLMSGDDSDSASPVGTVESFLSAAQDEDCAAAVELVSTSGISNVWPEASDRDEALETCESSPEGAEYTLEGTEVSDETDSTATVLAEMNVTSGVMPDQLSFDLTREDGSWRISNLGEGPDASTPSGTSPEVTPPSSIPDMTVPDVTVPDVTVPDDEPGLPEPPDPGSSGELGTASAPPTGNAPDDCGYGESLPLSECEQWADDCYDGDLAACDELYGNTAIDSALEAYGATCGGRVDDESDRSACESTYG